MKPAAPLRAGFLIDNLVPGAGTENQLLLLLEHFRRGGIEPFLCCLMEDPGRSARDLDCPVQVLGYRRLLSVGGLASLRKARGWARENALDVVVTFFKDATLVGSLGLSGTGIPVLSSRRNIGLGYWQSPRELARVRILNRLATGIVANSEAVRRYTVEAEKVPADRVSVVYNAVDTARFRPSEPDRRAALRREHGFPDSGLLVGCLANLRPVKGIDTLVRAWRIVVDTMPGSTLVLVGEGEERPRLETLCRDLGIEARVRFLGSSFDPGGLLPVFDIGVLPSRSEGFPNALLEFMAAGVSPVATEVGGNPELIRSPELGRLVPPDAPAPMARAILELAASEEDRAHIARAVRDHAERYHAIEPVLARWRDVLSASVPRRR